MGKKQPKEKVIIGMGMEMFYWCFHLIVDLFVIL